MSRCVACNVLIDIERRFYVNDNPMDDLCLHCAKYVRNPDSAESAEYQFAGLSEGLTMPPKVGYEFAPSEGG
jgi:hypothetical protein